MGGVRLYAHSFQRYLEVASVCAGVKHMAKAIAGSNLFLDRRGEHCAGQPAAGAGDAEASDGDAVGAASGPAGGRTEN